MLLMLTFLRNISKKLLPTTFLRNNLILVCDNTIWYYITLLLFGITTWCYSLHKKWSFSLTVQSCKLCKNKYMIASAQIANPEIFAFIAVLF